MLRKEKKTNFCVLYISKEYLLNREGFAKNWEREKKKNNRIKVNDVV
jgi:hypothetical protein